MITVVDEKPKNIFRTICEVNEYGGVSYFDENSAKFFVDPNKAQVIDQILKDSSKLHIHEFSFFECKGKSNYGIL